MPMNLGLGALSLYYAKASMRRSALNFCYTVGWRLPCIRALSSLQPVILVYHRVSKRDNNSGLDTKTFEKQILFLQQHFQIVSPNLIQNRRRPLDRIQIFLTFDDGFRNQAEVVAPILRRHNVPAMFFISSR